MENIKRKKKDGQERKRGGCSSSGGGVCVYRPAQLQPHGEKKALTRAPTRFIPPLARQLPTRAHTIFLSFPSFIHSINFFSCSFIHFSSSFYSHSSVCCLFVAFDFIGINCCISWVCSQTRNKTSFVRTQFPITVVGSLIFLKTL